MGEATLLQKELPKGEKSEKDKNIYGQWENKFHKIVTLPLTSQSSVVKETYTIPLHDAPGNRNS